MAQSSGSRARRSCATDPEAVQQYNAMTTDTHKPSEFVQTHGRWRNGSEFRKRARRSCATDPERVTVDDHATDTMTGTAHMLSDCVPSMTTATPSVGMCNGECFMFYGSHTGVRALRVLSVSRPECVPMTGSAGTMTNGTHANAAQCRAF